MGTSRLTYTLVWSVVGKAVPGVFLMLIVLVRSARRRKMRELLELAMLIGVSWGAFLILSNLKRNLRS